MMPLWFGGWIRGMGELPGRSDYKSLPCRGACGFGERGSAPAGFPSSGTAFAPINALGGCGRSISRCLFLQSRSLTPWNIATTQWKSRKRHYAIGEGLHSILSHALLIADWLTAPSFWGIEWRWQGVPAHSGQNLRLYCKQCFWGNWCHESRSGIVFKKDAILSPYTF
jgi:hypothetical protein